ncbi:hypothetical protein IPM65_00845 [Candidatus Roizmanbacteria bacterium]|nr:MAG: hypothetical protein IPM65_00845 [Candidatus Roizmanbacteria bacterium]
MSEHIRAEERRYPPGIYEVPQVEPVPVVLEEFGQQVSQRLHDVAQRTGTMPTIIAPLNGSVMPLYAVCREWQRAGGCVEDIAHQVHLVNTRKVGEAAECVILTEEDPGELAFVIEDIIDDGGTGEIIEKAYPETHFELHAPLSKVGKIETARAKLPRTKVTTTRTVDNVWIVGGGGLDGGSMKLNGVHDYQNVELAVAARLMDRYVYHNNDEVLPPYEEQLRAFTAARLPWITPGSTIHMWMLRAEWAKMKGKVDVLQDLASIFPYILQNEIGS